jgi:hypothetical protein
MEDAARRPERFRRRRRFEAVHKWSATAAAVVALAFSVYNFAELQRKPNVELTLPHVLRLENAGTAAQLYVQPTVSTRFKSENVEVIRDAHLKLSPAGAISSSKRPVFYWRETVTWQYDPDTDTVNNHWSSDPTPFTVSQDKPQQPPFKFRADNWTYQAGRYEGSLQLLRSADHTPLTKKFCLIISEAAAKELKDAEKTNLTIKWFLNNQPKFTASGNSPECYRRDID